MIEVKNLSVKRASFAIEELDLKVKEGLSFALLGPSGAGKTLLLETVLGLRETDGGSIHLDGRDMRKSPPESRSVAFLPQDLALFPHLSVFENIAFCLRLSREDEKNIASKVGNLAEKLAISHLLSRGSVNTLSGGEKQRVALARALARNPRYLFLDEPFCSLDGARRRELHQEVRKLQRDLGLTMFFVTHDLEEALVMADEIALMNGGRIEQQGSPQFVFSQPKTKWAARFLLFENVFSAALASENCAMVEDQKIFFHSPRKAFQDSSYFAIRSETFRIARGGAGEHLLRAFAEEPMFFGAKRVLPFRLSKEKDSRRFLLTLESDEGGTEVPEVDVEFKVEYSPQGVVLLEAFNEGGSN